MLPKDHWFSLIWLHGLGDDSTGFIDYFLMPHSPIFKGGKIILLQAPRRSVTIFDGEVCHSWYDILDETGTS